MIYIKAQFVYCSFCSTATELKLGGTLQELEQSINANSEGQIIGIYCDHKNDNEVKNVIDTIDKNEGRLDILVNNAFQIPDNSKDKDLLFKNFWEQSPLEFYDIVMNVGLRSHYVTSYYACNLLNKTARIEMKLSSDVRRMPLIAHVSSFGGISYSFNVAYGVGKAGVDRLAKDMHIELKPYGINTISVYPGVVRTERMEGILAGEAESEWTKRTGLAIPTEYIETPELTGTIYYIFYIYNKAYIIVCLI